MKIEQDGTIRNFSLNEKIIAEEDRISRENRRKATEAGNFLNSSGINNNVIDFREGFLGDIGTLTNEIGFGKTKNEFSASIILNWIDPDELRHLVIKISVGSSTNNEKYMSASFKEIPHYKHKKYDNLIHEIYVFNFGKDFNFLNPVSVSERERYKDWLSEKILNYRNIWGDID